MIKLVSSIAAIAILVIGIQAVRFDFSVQAQTAQIPGTAIYRYDSVGRLVQDVYPQNSGAYAYDAAGNRTSATHQ